MLKKIDLKKVRRQLHCMLNWMPGIRKNHVAVLTNTFTGVQPKRDAECKENVGLRFERLTDSAATKSHGKASHRGFKKPNIE